MKHLLFDISLLGILGVCLAARLPSTFKKCNKRQLDLNSCIRESVEDALIQLKKPIREVGLSNLEPLEFPFLSVEAGNGGVAFQQIYKNVKLFGLTASKCSKAGVNFEERTIFAECTIPYIKMDFDYEVNGKILLLPLFGSGPGSITLENVHESFIMNFEEYQKKNKKHYKVVKSKISMEPSLMQFRLENLFNGDKTLSEPVLRVMNENWEAIYADVRSSYESAFAQIFASVFNSFFDKVPVEELFDEN